MAARSIQLLCISCNICLIVQMCSLQGIVCDVPDDVLYTDLHRHVRIGDRVVLKCQFRGTPLAVYWKKGDDPRPPLNLVSWLRGDPVTGLCEGEKPCRIMEMNEDRSLVIKEVSIAEQGRYICKVANYKGKIIQNVTEISVFSPPKEPYPFINECLRSPGMTSNQTCVISTTEDPINISCTASGYFPDLDLVFIRNYHYMTTIHSEETTNVDGKKIKSITIQASPCSERYVCVATDIPGVGGRRVASVLVTTVTTSVYRSDSTLAVGIVVPLIAIIVLVAVILYVRAILHWHIRRQEPVSYVELWKLVDETDLAKVNDIVGKLVGNPEKNLGKEDLYTRLCKWKEGSSVNVRSLYRAIKNLGFHDVLKTIKDFRASTSFVVSDDDVLHICWYACSCEEETVKPILRALDPPNMGGRRPLYSTRNSFEDDPQMMKGWKSSSVSEAVILYDGSEEIQVRGTRPTPERNGDLQSCTVDSLEGNQDEDDEMTAMDPGTGEGNHKVKTSSPNQMIRLCLAVEEAGKTAEERQRPSYLQMAKTFFKIPDEYKSELTDWVLDGFALDVPERQCQRLGNTMELPENVTAAENEDGHSVTNAKKLYQNLDNCGIRRRQAAKLYDRHDISGYSRVGSLKYNAHGMNSQPTSGLIQIQVLNYDSKTHMVRVRPTDTVKDLKVKIQEKVKIAPSQQWLQFQGRILEDESTSSLECHGLQDLSTVHLHGRLRGGSLF